MAERQIFAQPAANGRAGTITAPFQFLVDGADNLRVEGWSSVAGVTLEIAFRFANFDGSILPQRYTVALTANRQSTALDIGLAPGYLLNLSVFVVGAAPKIGETFVCLKLIRGFGGATIVLGLLLQGYVTAEQGLGWPGSPIEDSLSGSGAVKLIVGTNPAAGAEMLETVPAGARWELQALRIVLVNSAVAGNRRPRLVLDDGVNIFGFYPQATPTIAGAAAGFIWAMGLAYDTTFASDQQVAGLPVGLRLLEGHRLGTSTVGMDPGDNYTAPVLVVREWLEVDA